MSARGRDCTLVVLDRLHEAASVLEAVEELVHSDVGGHVW
jgi:hypothetical protein